MEAKKSKVIAIVLSPYIGEKGFYLIIETETRDGMTERYTNESHLYVNAQDALAVVDPSCNWDRYCGDSIL